MGTNYFLQKAAGEHDPFDEPLHIGKSSGGWCFSLHVEPTDPEHPQSLDDWARLFFYPGNIIKDEYGATIPPEKMMLIITERKWAHPSRPKCGSYAVPGPNGLLLPTIDGVSCVGHGRGTWSLNKGWFR